MMLRSVSLKSATVTRETKWNWVLSWLPLVKTRSHDYWVATVVFVLDQRLRTIVKARLTPQFITRPRREWWQSAPVPWKDLVELVDLVIVERPPTPRQYRSWR
jgi:hypothetical protein